MYCADNGRPGIDPVLVARVRCDPRSASRLAAREKYLNLESHESCITLVLDRLLNSKEGI